MRCNRPSSSHGSTVAADTGRIGPEEPAPLKPVHPLLLYVADGLDEFQSSKRLQEVIRLTGDKLKLGKILHLSNARRLCSCHWIF